MHVYVCTSTPFVKYSFFITYTCIYTYIDIHMHKHIHAHSCIPQKPRQKERLGAQISHQNMCLDALDMQTLFEDDAQVHGLTLGRLGRVCCAYMHVDKVDFITLQK